MLKRAWPIVIMFVACYFALRSAALATTSITNLVDESQRYELLGRADILDDLTGELDIDDVAHDPSFRRSSADSQPADDAVRWYRFRLATPPRSEGRWYLVTWEGCSDADLFQPRGDGRFSSRPFGHQTPFARHSAPSTYAALELGQIHEETLFVRLQCYRETQELRIESADHLQGADSLSQRIRDGVVLALLLLATLAAALALLMRSAQYGMLAATGFAGALFFCDDRFPQFFPHAVPPSSVITDLVLFDIFIVCQWLFYDRFLALGTNGRATRRLLAFELMCVLASSLYRTYAPLVLYRNVAFEWTIPLPLTCFYATVTIVAVILARRSNRSAWFLAAGTSLFTLGTLSAPTWAIFFYQPERTLSWALLLRQIWNLAVPFEMILFILGVGDQLRQTSLAYQRALQEKDAILATLAENQQKHIVEIERRNAAFSRFVPREFLRQLDRPEIVEVELGDHVEREMAILFTDIRGFTALAERLTPGETFDFLNAYLARAGPVVRSHRGFVDKYIGDSIVALFPERPSDALDAAIALQNEVRRFNEDRARKGGQPIAVGVGLHFGKMMLGTIGESERYETTVIADSVNVAARLEGLTKEYGSSIIASASLVATVDGNSAYCLRPLGDVTLRGHERTENAYEVFDGDPHELVLHKLRTQGDFCAALDAYRSTHYVRSAELFRSIARIDPRDTAAAYLCDRSLALARSTGLAVADG